MFPRHYNLDEAALIVWHAASKGRANARAGLRSSAAAYMEGLAKIGICDGPASLHRIARSAAEDINHLLNGTPIEASSNGGSAA